MASIAARSMLSASKAPDTCPATHVVVFRIFKVTVRGIVQLVAFLPNTQHNRTQPDGKHDDQLRQIEGEKFSFILPQSMIHAEPEH
uniref:Uncharacterized protein n=1 Tax=Anopheles minimus TaxID=112268 RepID=A0A182WNY1_9DIPT